MPECLAGVSPGALPLGGAAYQLESVDLLLRDLEIGNQFKHAIARLEALFQRTYRVTRQA